VIAFEVLFDSRQRILVVRFGRALTQPAMEAMNAAVERFVAREGPCPGILDLVAVEEVALPSAYVAKLAQRKGVLVRERRVIVAPKDELFGLARMFGAYNDATGEHIVVVRDLPQAYAALGVSDLELQPVD
jgi:hypothetical protein